MNYKSTEEIEIQSATESNNKEKYISNGVGKSAIIENNSESNMRIQEETNLDQTRSFLDPTHPSIECKSFKKDNNNNCAVFKSTEKINSEDTIEMGRATREQCQLNDKEIMEQFSEENSNNSNLHTNESSGCSTQSSRVDKLIKDEEETIGSDTILTERWSPLGANCDDSASVDISELASGGDSESELLSYQSDQISDKNLRDKYVKLMMNDFSLRSSELQLEEDIADRYDDIDIQHEERLKSLEEEHEFLTSSLMALTSHFAHVQLRVRQIVEAPTQQRDELLKDLEEFAFREIPDVSAVITTAPKRGINNIKLDSENSGDVVDSAISVTGNGDETATLMLHQRQSELIHYLKSQLVELEKLAYESGAPVLPQHILLEKQKIIIDELKRRLNFKVDDNKLPELSTEELKVQVDHALGEFVGPLKMKEQLVTQLKTQITDLERFIAFLQCDTDENKLNTLTGGKSLDDAYNSYAVKQKKDSQNYGLRKIQNNHITADKNKSNQNFTENRENMQAIKQQVSENMSEQKSLHTKAHSLMDKASLLLQMFATTHFGNGSQQFQKNTLKRTHKGNHWGDLRAQLEVDVQEVASLAATLACDREKLLQMQNALQKNERKPRALQKKSSDAVLAYQKNSNTGSNLVLQQSESLDLDIENEQILYYPNKRVLQRAKFQGDSIDILRKELTMAVRKNFSTTLAHLIQHGLETPNINDPISNNLIVPFMRCLNPIDVSNRQFRNTNTTMKDFSNFEEKFEDYEDYFRVNYPMMNAWQLILEYYQLKRGDDYNNTPARKLSQSFNLNIVDSSHITVKQNLLASIGAIIATHRPYKRSPNAHFKAFVSAGLNCHQLVEWLNLIFNCNELVEMYYSPNSYVARTGFRDALRTINILTKYDFELPVDFAIKHFRHL